MATTRERIAAEVRAELARQQRTTTEVAESAGMVTSTLIRKMQARYPFDTDELERVAAALGVTVTELLSRADATEQEAV